MLSEGIVLTPLTLLALLHSFGFSSLLQHALQVYKCLKEDICSFLGEYFERTKSGTARYLQASGQYKECQIERRDDSCAGKP